MEANPLLLLDAKWKQILHAIGIGEIRTGYSDFQFCEGVIMDGNYYPILLFLQVVLPNLKYTFPWSSPCPWFAALFIIMSFNTLHDGFSVHIGQHLQYSDIIVFRSLLQPPISIAKSWSSPLFRTILPIIT